MNPTRRQASWALGLIAAGFLFLTGSLSRHFPAVNTDEIFISVHGVNLVAGQGQRYSLFDDLFAPSVSLLRDAFPQTLLTPYNAWVGFWASLGPRSYWHARLSSVVAGGLALLVFYGIGRILAGPSLGLLFSALLAFNPIFISAACVVRPEIVLLLTSSLIIRLILHPIEHFTGKPFCIGLLMGLQLGIHPNALPVGIGLAAFYAAAEKHERRKDLMLFLPLGTAAGVLLLLLSVDLYRLWLCTQTFMFQLYRPPVLSLSLSQIVLSALETVSTTQVYYFINSTAGGWKECLRLWQAASVLSLMGLGFAFRTSGKTKSSLPWVTAFVIGGSVTWLSEALLLKKHETFYLLNLFPFLIPLIAAGLLAVPRARTRFRHAWRGLQALLLIISLGCFGAFVKDTVRGYTPYPRLIQQLHDIVPDAGLKMASPNLLWFGWNPALYRDIGALVYSRWYTGGQQDMRGWLSPWKPDIFIVDEAFKRVYLGRGETAALLRGQLKLPVQSLGTLDSGPGADGILEIYRIDWKNASR